MNTEEKDAILAVCNSAEYQSLPPSQIVPCLADQGVYLASESTFYRVLREHGQAHRRGRAQPPRAVPRPRAWVAYAPLQTWSWDMPAYPKKPFASIEQARQWVQRFVTWYNTEHRHSAIKFVTPEQRHYGH
ncbi:transposase [Pusillimonas sp. CC-YST705]|uniref:Transposase n=1 Tax=Mesopusillimonas faecipullorum TaxID=2755040 RepID=A0ABS8CG72_9BURK|nr:integrase core domain-containing protein [Mesopusillimonas faecipullorum]MCB5365039.1 transposase [Mesopusillimonas faecipullorum]